MKRAAIELHDVTKMYRRYAYRRQFSTLKSALLKRSLASDLKPDEVFSAVNGVSLRVNEGKPFGIVGRNGSGKSTMLKLIAGITKPTTGTVAVQGRISALIELGAGFHPEISGRENVFINGVMLGLSTREIARRFDEIVAFAELEQFIDAPVKTYSSGMYMRLGFAVAVHVDPDILLVDEVLAVGDEGFSLRCIDKFAEFKRRGKTIVLVTHGLAMVERFCDEAIWIDDGRMRAQGDPRRVIHAYVTDVEKSEERQLTNDDRKALVATQARETDGEALSLVHDQPVKTEDSADDMFSASSGRWGTGLVKIVAVSVEGDGGPSHVFHTGDQMRIRLQVTAPELVDDFVFGISIFNAEGVCCYGTNTAIEELTPDAMAGDGEVLFTIDSLDLVDGTYKLDVAVHKKDGAQYDYHRLLYTFRVKSRTKDVGIFRPSHRWTFTPNIRFKPSLSDNDR